MGNLSRGTGNRQHETGELQAGVRTSCSAGKMPKARDHEDSSGEAAGQRPVGLLAAWGNYPFEVVAALKRNRRRVVCAAVRDHADPRLADHCNAFAWIGIGRLGKAIRFFRGHGVERATMAGKFHKVLLYRPWFWFRHLPDWTTVKTFYPHVVAGSKDQKDDTLLGTLSDAFAAEGIEFAPATEFAPELLVQEGAIAGKPLSAAQWRDVQFGWRIAKEMGRLDIGQSVCVCNRAVLSVEAIEGTDACIRRAGELCPRGGFTVIKVAKPQQDMRFDVPTIGLGTLDSMAAAGARVLAVEADRAILLDRAAFHQVARARRISVVAVRDAALTSEAIW